MRINQNIAGLNAYRNLVSTDNRMNKSLEKLSSGLRINRAADDAAGLAISEKMRGQIRGLNKAIANAQDGISLIQTAEGALNEVHSILQRMRELTVQSSNDTLTANDRMELQKEVDQLIDEINRIANTTEFNTKKLLDGTASAFVSSDKLATKVYMRDGLRIVDKYGVKSAEEDNYRLAIKVNDVGVTQVQSTHVFLDKNTDAVATGGTLLSDINLFWDNNGNFILQNPQTITLIQGDGQRAKVTVDASDTLNSLVAKLNDAIANDLGQGAYVASGIADQFVQIAASGLGGLLSVEGTMVINSAVAGKFGEITFMCEESLYTALGLNTVRDAEEASYSIDVTDADSGDVVASGVVISGNLLMGVVHPNVDVLFDARAGFDTVANFTATGGFALAAATSAYETMVHLANNTMVFHIGANPGQDVNVGIARMDSYALGVDNILITNREAAALSVSLIDRAIDTVSAERSKLGAIQNRLEHTMLNLGVAAENLNAAESRIRDLDMAQEMIEFTRNQIMLQAGTAMLAQANLKPQAVLTLIG